MLKFLTRFSALMAVLIISALPLDAFAIRPRYKAVSYNTSRPAFERLVRGLTPTMDIRPGKLSQLDSDPQTVLDASNLTMWLDPNQNTTTVDGKVSQWDASDTSGISFTQGTASARPILSRSDNQEQRLPYESFDNATYWVQNNITAASDGVITANAGTAQAGIRQQIGYRALAFSGETIRLRIEAEYINNRYLQVGEGGDTQWHNSVFDLIDGTNTAAGTYTTTNTITRNEDDTAWVIIVEWTQVNSASNNIWIYLTKSSGDLDSPNSETWVGTEQFQILSAQITHTDADSTYLPATGTPQYRGINGNKGLVFLGGQALVSTATNGDLFDNNAAAKYFVTVPFSAPTNSYVYYAGGRGWVDTNAGDYRHQNYDGTSDFASSTPTLNAINIIRATQDGVNVSISLDTGSGFASDTDTASGNTTDMTKPIHIGASATTGTSGFNGYILDIITADASSQADVEAYLQAKYFNVVNPRVNQIDSTIGSVSFTQATDANKPLLTEGGRRENLIVGSEVLSGGTYFSQSGLTTVTANSTANPINGASDADTIVESGAGGAHYIQQQPNIISGVQYRFSVYAKTSGRGITLQFDSTAFGSSYNAHFNLSSGTVAGSHANITSTIDSLGNGWYRCNAVATSTASNATANMRLLLNQNNTTTSYTGDSSSGAIAWGFQLQRASMSPTYIPTNSLPRHGSLTGQMCLYYDGSNDIMNDTSTDMNTLLGTSAYDIFGVVKDEANTGTPIIFGDTGGYAFVRHQTSARIQMINYGAGGLPISPSGTALEPVVFNGYLDSGNVGININGGTYTTAADTPLSTSAGTVNIGGTGNAHKICRVLSFNKNPGTSTRQRLIKGFKRFYRVN